jgi:hypothetical protein
LSLETAARTGRTHEMSLQRYDVRDAGGAFVTRFWKPEDTPIFDDQSRLLFLLHHVEDVTDSSRSDLIDVNGQPARDS